MKNFWLMTSLLVGSAGLVACQAVEPATGSDAQKLEASAQLEQAQRVLTQAASAGRIVGQPLGLPEGLQVRTLGVSAEAVERQELNKAGAKPQLETARPAFSAEEAGHYQRELHEALPITEGMSITLTLPKDDFVLGEPVMVRASLTNTSDRVRRLPPLLDPQFQYNHFLVTTPSGRELGYSPVAIACSRGEMQFENLAPGEVRVEDIPLHFHKDGWLFSEVGQYRIQALFRGTSQDAERLDSNVLTLTVEPGSARDQEAAQLMMGHDQGLFTMWGEGDHLEDGISSLEQLVARYPETTLATYARYALGSNLSVDFFDGRFRAERKAQPGEALAYLMPLVEQLKAGSGPELSPAMIKGAFILASRDYARLGQQEQARATLLSFLNTQALAPQLSERDLAQVQSQLNAL